MIELPVTPGRVDNAGTFKHIELEICTYCDLACWSCDRFSDVTSAPPMTVAQVKRFADESLDLKWQWERIRLLGGEPTLHPQLEAIVAELMRYRRFYSKCFLQLLSNGRGKLEKVREWLIDRGVDPHVEAKEPGITPIWFNNTRVCEVDRHGPDCPPRPPCGIYGVRGCGIGLTRNGYFLDGAGAAIARVTGLDVGVMRLADVTHENMLKQAAVLCRLCGHWNPSDGRVTKLVSETGEVTGEFWRTAIAMYSKQKPAMTVYGDG